MTSGSGVSSWLHRDSFSVFLHGLEHSVLALSCCLLFVFVPICFLAFLRARNPEADHTRVALQALVTVLVPTCSLWPSRYIGLASAFRLHIDIPLEMIIKDTINGIIEFRNPSVDLADLIDSGRTVNKHIICISIGWEWWIKYIQWWILVKSKSDRRSPGYMLELSGWLHHGILTAKLTPLDLPPSPFDSALSTSFPPLCLDCLPYGAIPSLWPGCRTTLEFTAFSPSLRVLSPAQIISAIPFMISERPRHRPRSLVSVLKQLGAAYGPNMVIESVSNVSTNYEHALRHVSKSFSEEQKVRETWVKVMGVRAWRQELFLVAFEAALVRRGWIERWAIQIVIK